MASARTLLSDGRAIKVRDGSIVIRMAGDDGIKVRIPCRSGKDARTIRNYLLTAARKNVQHSTEKNVSENELYNVTMMAFVSKVEKRRRDFIEGTGEQEPIPE